MTQEETSANGKASRVRTTFRLEYSVTTNVAAPPERIWALLTNASDFPRWNSTVSSIEGNIALGEKIKLRAPTAPGRVFDLTVKEFVPETKMVWTSGTGPIFGGVRTFTLAPKADGSTDFTMVEVFSGLMLPMIAGSIPDQRSIFEQYASNLKSEAERRET